MSGAAEEQSISQERFGEVISSLRRRLSKLEEDNAKLQNRVDELEEENNRLEEKISNAKEFSGKKRSQLSGRIATLEDADTVGQDDLREEQISRTQEDAKLRQRINKVAQKADVTVTDTDIMGDDRIQTVIDDGPEAIVDGRLSPVHERAADLLLKIDEWGKRVSDANGRRFVIKTGDAKSRLNDYRGESLQSVEVGRVFDKIDSWAADSPRDVTIDKAPDGQRRMTITVEAA